MGDRILDCGHPPSEHSPHTTGTAHTPDGRELCWECADTLQRESMRTESHVMAYLSSDGRSVTTWSGGLLGSVNQRHARTHYGFRGVKYDRHYLDVTDTNGRRWYGTSPGPGMYVRLHARKER